MADKRNIPKGKMHSNLVYQGNKASKKLLSFSTHKFALPIVLIISLYMSLNDDNGRNS